MMLVSGSRGYNLLKYAVGALLLQFEHANMAGERGTLNLGAGAQCIFFQRGHA